MATAHLNRVSDVPSAAADGSILRSVIGRRSWRQWRAVTRFLLLQFCRNLPKQTGQERPQVDRLPRFEFELLRLLVARAVEHRIGDANRQGPMLRVRLVGFQHALEDIDRGMLEGLVSAGVHRGWSPTGRLRHPFRSAVQLRITVIGAAVVLGSGRVMMRNRWPSLATSYGVPAMFCNMTSTLDGSKNENKPWAVEPLSSEPVVVRSGARAGSSAYRDHACPFILRDRSRADPHPRRQSRPSTWTRSLRGLLPHPPTSPISSCKTCRPLNSACLSASCSDGSDSG
jgi:hypothetical protein